MAEIHKPTLRETLAAISPPDYFASFLGLNEFTGGRLGSIDINDIAFTLVLERMLKIDAHSTPASWHPMGNVDTPTVEGVFDDPASSIDVLDDGFRIKFAARMPLQRECVVLPIQMIKPSPVEL